MTHHGPALTHHGPALTHHGPALTHYGPALAHYSSALTHRAAGASVAATRRHRASTLSQGPTPSAGGGWLTIRAVATTGNVDQGKDKTCGEGRQVFHGVPNANLVLPGG